MPARRAAAALALVLLTGCGTDSLDPVAQTGRPCDRADAGRVLSETAGATVQLHEDLAGMLPNVRYAGPGRTEQARAVTDSAVLGRVVDVSPDRGFVEQGQPGTAGRPGATVTSYDDPAADWRTVRVTVAADEVLAGPATDRLAFDVGLFGDEDEAAVECALDGLGTVVVFSRALPASPEFLGIPRQLPDEPFGVATVDDAGRLSFPFAAGAQTSEAFLDGLDTIEELRTAVRQPVRTVAFDR